MPRGIPNPKPAVETKPKLESGLGEMSEADRAAIMGTPMAPGPILEPGAEPEEFGLTSEEAVARAGLADPAEVSLGARMMTVESRMTKVEAALEQWAAMMNDRPTMMAHLAAQGPAVIRKATREEEAAYCRWNFEATGIGELPFDGIQAWRDAGSPGLKAKGA